MNARIIWLDPERRIDGIKGIRAATGLSLRDAKAVSDAVLAGTPTEVSLNTTFDADFESIAGYEIVQPDGDPHAVVREFIAALPGDMTVREIRAVLDALRQVQP